MSKFVSTIVLMLFVGAFVFFTGKTASAGAVYSPGCSQIEGVDATTLVGGTCTAGVCDTSTGDCNDGVTPG